jgi:Tfp pilus assembly protein PilW
MNKNSSTSQRKRPYEAGFSLIDVMVGMVLSLIATIIIFQVFEVSQNANRASTSGGDAQQNGAAALYDMERSLRNAGYGVNSNDGNPAPVSITAGAANMPDSITLTYRQNWDYGPFMPDTTAFPSAVPPNLTVETIAVNNSAQLVSSVNGVLAEGIVQLKAAPVMDGATMVAVQAALVARSSQAEKPQIVGGVPQCNTTPAYPVWVGGTLDLSAGLGLPGGTDWKCYRYKTFYVTVPIRNVIWHP